MKKSLGAKTIIYPIPVWVIGTYDKEKKPNVATVAWGGYVAPNHHVLRSPFVKRHIRMEISWKIKLSL